MKGTNKYLSAKAISRIKRHQKLLQMREFENKGKKGKSIAFYQALDNLLGVTK